MLPPNQLAPKRGRYAPVPGTAPLRPQTVRPYDRG
jgi:hypothetical protein